MRLDYKHIIFYLMMLLWAGVTIAQPVVDISSPINVTGVVTDATNDEPCIGATVLVKGFRHKTCTGFNGEFSIEAGIGDTLVVDFMGYETTEKVVNGHPMKFRLLPPRFWCSRCRSISGWTGHALYGTVYNQNAKPFSGATVTSIPSGNKVLTDSNGHFDFTLIEKGDDSLKIEHPLYKPVQGPIDGLEFVIRLEQKIVTVKVIDGCDGEPLVGAFYQRDNSPMLNRSDLNGEFKLCAKEGAILTISYPGFLSKDVIVDSCDTITVALEVDKQTLDMFGLKEKNPIKLYQVLGTVVDENDEPLIGANVCVKGYDLGTLTDFEGHFSLKVPEGVVIEAKYYDYFSKDVQVEKNPMIIRLEHDDNCPILWGD